MRAWRPPGGEEIPPVVKTPVDEEPVLPGSESGGGEAVGEGEAVEGALCTC
jgi:hypothetical protein